MKQVQIQFIDDSPFEDFIFISNETDNVKAVLDAIDHLSTKHIKYLLSVAVDEVEGQ